STRSAVKCTSHSSPIGRPTLLAAATAASKAARVISGWGPDAPRWAKTCTMGDILPTTSVPSPTGPPGRYIGMRAERLPTAPSCPTRFVGTLGPSRRGTGDHRAGRGQRDPGGPGRGRPRRQQVHPRDLRDLRQRPATGGGVADGPVADP